MAALGGGHHVRMVGVDSLDNLGQLDRQTADTLATRHLEQLRFGARGPPHRRQNADDYLHMGLLGALFPRAKVIHCRRDLRDVAVSCWMTHFHEVQWANEPQHIASRFQQYLRLMEHWWRVQPLPFLEIDYEETVADLETVARRLVAWCGLEWEPGCLEYHRSQRTVRTASVVQVRKPVYKTSVKRWQHYAGPLAELFATLPEGK